MKRIEGGSKVKGGFYFNQKGWNLETVSGKTGVLPGTAAGAGPGPAAPAGLVLRGHRVR